MPSSSVLNKINFSNSKYNIFKIGVIDYRIQNIWDMIYDFILSIINKNNKINICFDDNHKNIDCLNKGDKYASSTELNTPEFHQFINKLRNLHKNISFYGISTINTNNNICIDNSLSIKLFGVNSFCYSQTTSPNKISNEIITLINRITGNKTILITNNNSVDVVNENNDILSIGTSVFKGKINNESFSDKGSLPIYVSRILGSLYNKKQYVVINKQKYLNNKLSFYNPSNTTILDSKNPKKYIYVKNFNYIVHFPKT